MVFMLEYTGICEHANIIRVDSGGVEDDETEREIILSSTQGNL